MSTNHVTDDAINSLVTTIEYTAPDDNLWQWFLYAILGAGNVLTNLPILLLFVVYQTFREKEYLLVVALCFGDTLSGVGYFAAGISRSWHVIRETHNDKVSSLDCMLTIHNILWIPVGSYLFAALIMLCISLDRIASVWVPIRHMHWGMRYVWSMIGVSTAFTLGFGVIGLYPTLSKPSPTIVPSFCYMTHAVLGTNWVATQYLMLTIVTALSVGNYLIVMIIGRRFYSKAMAALTAQQASLKHSLELQRRLTISLGLSSLATFVFAVAPYGAGMVLEYMRWNNTGRLAVMLWTMTLLLLLLRMYLNEEAIRTSTQYRCDDLDVRLASDPRQHNGYDCGFFVVQFVECLSRDSKLSFSQADMPGLRLKMMQELLLRKLQ